MRRSFKLENQEADPETNEKWVWKSYDNEDSEVLIKMQQSDRWKSYDTAVGKGVHVKSGSTSAEGDK